MPNRHAAGRSAHIGQRAHPSAAHALEHQVRPVVGASDGQMSGQLQRDGTDEHAEDLVGHHRQEAELLPELPVILHMVLQQVRHRFQFGQTVRRQVALQHRRSQPPTHDVGAPACQPAGGQSQRPAVLRRDMVLEAPDDMIRHRLFGQFDLNEPVVAGQPLRRSTLNIPLHSDPLWSMAVPPHPFDARQWAVTIPQQHKTIRPATVRGENVDKWTTAGQTPLWAFTATPQRWKLFRST